MAVGGVKVPAVKAASATLKVLVLAPPSPRSWSVTVTLNVWPVSSSA